MVIPGLALLFIAALPQSGPDQIPTGQPAASTARITTLDTQVGKGKTASTGDVVTIDYVGTLSNGTAFDSTEGRGPFTFILGVGEVIKGMDQGVAGMKEGGVRTLTIPADLGYGAKSIGPIPPNATLTFKVTLVRIEPKVTSTVVVKGSGPEAKFNDHVSAFVKVSLESGKVVTDTRDSTKDPVDLIVGERGMPVGMVVGLLGMKAGETRKVLVPPALGFTKGIPPVDEKGRKAGSVIPPNSVIQFEIQVVKVEPTTG